MKNSIILAALIVVGCVAALTEEELEQRDWRRNIDAENWQLCKLAYKQSGLPTYHMNHSHSFGARATGGELAASIRSDLSVNKCRLVLRDYWADY